MNGSLNVLIVEDSEDDALLLLRELRRGGFEAEYKRVDSSETMKTALDEQRWDVVISDHNMPGFSAPAALSILKERSLDLPFIIVSGNIGEDIAVAAMKAGAHDYLMKGKLARLVPAVDRELREAAGRRARRKSETDLQQANETMASILESFPDIIMVIGENAEVRFSNPAAVQFANALELNDHLPAPIDKLVREVMETGEDLLPTNFGEAYRFRIQNEDKFFLPRAVAMRNKVNDIFGVALLLQDVTAFRLLDDVKSDLIATVSHELKTPLTSVRMALHLLLEESVGPVNSRQREMMSIARDDSERLLRLLNALLDLARFEEGLPQMYWETVNPGQIAEVVVEETRSAAQSKRLKVTAEVEPNLPVIRVDRVRITHVVTNFMTNAIKYSPDEGKVVVKIQRKDGTVRFSVIDQGPGIPAEYQSRIFDKFFRVPGQGNTGAGLGLAIAKEFVKAHRGTVGVISELGRGSEFYIDLQLGE